MSVIKFNLKDNSLKKKVDVVCKICLTESLSDTELCVLAAVILYSTNNSITITPDIGRQIKTDISISDTNFSTSLFRLEKKGVFTKTGRTITLHPAFTGIHDCDRISVSFIQNNPAS